MTVPDGPAFERPAIVVSACLVGIACNHRGEGTVHPGVEALRGSARLVPVCPEVAGGLATPRSAAERSPDGRVRTATGVDVTSLYERGAAHAVSVARAVKASQAVLKARSPSCGCGQLYDGSHRGILRPGDGVTAQAMREAGIEVVSEEDVESLGQGSPGAADHRGAASSSD